ncbi:sarcosine oxidase subunit gamma [uncultured Roseobacter sp.]|uniref:sarcosine oxidase subunit gamma n=1 Tax=uncultured Roseobacter sp. TaxID=114847 RepID=UPI00260BAB22|nr:sarcosine oxidase subunit gamma [uncultured Roseobacter sp.]
MVDLTDRSPCAGSLPLRIGTLTVTEVELGRLTTVSPFLGQRRLSAQRMEAAHGIPWPEPNRTTGTDAARAIWFGHDTVLLAGPAADPSLAQSAALTDQSDAWATMRVSGAGAEAVLARLVPVDLRPARFEEGHTARTLIKQMTGSVTRTGPDVFLLMVFRSMAQTLVHDLTEAMEAVAARG